VYGSSRGNLPASAANCRTAAALGDSILVGTINEGTVRVRESLMVRCQGGEVPAMLDGIETIDRGPVQEASAGQQVGLTLAGIRKDQPARGDRVRNRVSAHD
jgi:selenocysteine-specific translation elongation factor